VWRADKPQKGRYREFYQCDADVIGSDSLLNEVELIQIINDVFTKLDIPVIIKLNNRKILQGIAEMMGTPDKMVDIAIAIDKVDKIGMDGVERELRDRGFNDEQVMRLVSLMLVKSQDRMPRKLQLNNLITIKETLINEREERTRFDLGYLKNHADYGESENVKKGLNELERILDSVGEASKLIEFDISLARGLNYYTGSIIEVKIDPKSNSKFGSSICGGGRYDDLTSLFGPVQGFEKLSGVGVSFGADRIYDVLEELGKFPADVTTSTKVMFVNFGEAEAVHCLGLVAELRKAGVSAELYPDAAKFKKQMGYADDKKIAYVVFVGADEIKKGVVKLKNMKSGEEKEIPSTELVKNIL
jgi:histidyl-tRNA synthetase